MKRNPPKWFTKHTFVNGKCWCGATKDNDIENPTDAPLTEKVFYEKMDRVETNIIKTIKLEIEDSLSFIKMVVVFALVAIFLKSCL